jgi:hypothetical protein
MDLTIREGFGVLTAILVLAGVAMIVTNGGDVAKILSSGGQAFSGMVRAATLR